MHSVQELNAGTAMSAIIRNGQYTKKTKTTATTLIFKIIKYFLRSHSHPLVKATDMV